MEDTKNIINTDGPLNANVPLHHDVFHAEDAHTEDSEGAVNAPAPDAAPAAEPVPQPLQLLPRRSPSYNRTAFSLCRSICTFLPCDHPNQFIYVFILSYCAHLVND